MAFLSAHMKVETDVAVAADGPTYLMFRQGMSNSGSAAGPASAGLRGMLRTS